MARCASLPSLYSLESSCPRQAGIHSRFSRSLFLSALGLGEYTFGFLLPAEYFFHIHAGFLHHLGIEVRVDIGRCLVVRVAQYLHGNQRFHACLEQQRSEIMPEVMRRQGRLQALHNVVLPLGACLDFPLLHAMSIFHQTEPDALEATLRPRLACFRMEYILLREAAHLRQHGAKLSGDRYIAVGGVGFQIAVTGREPQKSMSRWTCTRSSSKSKSPHCRPSASPRRRPR